ncbi:unnamed protein product [Mytilus coruscus]|uniref:Uncharacterized protein n=1 Tax=Mytilus coruscus TaxID=42192 RepID=A0A6J8C734_MYTCO|nr:unnamed protein product [Mytilus coruscus]
MRHLLPRLCIEKLYKTFVRSLLDYVDANYDNCSSADSANIEHVQRRASTISTGAIRVTKHVTLLKEVGIELLKTRHVHILDNLNISRVRNTPDDVVNGFGRKLLEFCKSNKVFILNGRVGQDVNAKPTSRNNSVIDYIICTSHFLQFVSNFEIGEFSKLFSDVHSPLSLHIDCQSLIKNKVIENNFAQQNMIGKWKIEKINEYRTNIDTDKVDYVISKLNTYNDKENISKNDMNNLVHEVSDILTDSAKLTFGKNVYTKTILRNSKKQNNKQWYDKDCYKAKKELRKSQRLYKHYGSNIFKERLRQSEIYYKKVMDENIKKLNADMNKLDDICELKNLVVGLANSMNKFCDILTKRMGDIETNIPKQVANMIDQKVSEEMKKVREEFKTELKTVSEKVISLEQSYSDVVKQNKMQTQVVSEDNLSLVIKNLPETENENISCKVEDLIKDGLHVNSIQVVDVERKKNNHPGKHGIVIVKFQNKDDKQKVMEKKRELRSTRIYKDVYINNAIPNAQRLLNSNLRNIVKAIGNDKLEIRGSLSGNRGYYRRNDRGRGNTRGGNSHNTDQRSTYRNGQSATENCNTNSYNHNQSESNLNGRGRGNYRGQNGGQNQNSRGGHK